MDEQRQESYLNLIKILLTCSGEEEAIQVLNAHLELVDEDLVYTIEKVAAVAVKEGEAEGADYLLDLAEQIGKVLEDSENVTLFLPQGYREFFHQVIAVTNESQGDWQQVYSFLQRNLDKLNYNFAQMLHHWSAHSQYKLEPEMRRQIASIIGNFSITIMDFPLGSRADNLEIAIAGLEAVITVFPRADFPQEWGSIQNNLGNAYGYRIRGERAENLETSIHHYYQALQVRDRETVSEYWTETQNNLGESYRARIRGDKAENIEQAIVCYSQALLEYTREKFPEDWAMVQSNLGNAYAERIRGDRAENIDQAIRCYSKALEIRTSTGISEKWAETQNNRGNAYSLRILGDKAENIEQAIVCYSQALLEYTRENFPEDWAMVQNNLGRIYLQRIRGDREENVERGISCLLQALKVRTYEAFPEKRAETQHNLGEAYLRRLRGDRAENINQSIVHLSQALQIYDKEAFPEQWASTQHDLANVYLIQQPNEEIINRAISCCLKALEVRTRADFPEQWAETQHNLGVAYDNLINFCKDFEPQKCLEQCIECYQNALQVRTKEAFPQSYAETQLNLGITYQKVRDFSKAYQAYNKAIDIVENSLRTELISGSEGMEDKRKLAEEWNILYGRMVEVCLNLGKLREFTEYVERSKTRNLVELILTRDRHTIFPAEVVTQLDRLRDEITRGQYELQNATAEDPTTLAQHLQQLRQERNELQDQYLPIGSGFQFEPFRSTLSDRTAIVEFYITTDRLLVFIITNQTQQPIVLPPDFINPNKLANWANSYLKAYSNKKSHWQRRLTTRLHLLAKILHVDEIIEQIPTECDRLILIPHRYLHLLPLHALPLTEDSSLFDRFPGGVSYAPSCQLQQLAQTRQRPEFTHLFAVQNPTGDLSYTDLEVETIQSYFNTTNLLKEKIATKEAIDNTSLSNVHCAHFSCHAYFNESESRKSALILANAELNSAPTQSDPENYLSLKKGGVLDLNKCLTLDGIFTLNLEQCRLVTLSACETGLIDFQNTSDEYIGLPSGFLYAGASNVVSSLWTVNDISTAFLMIKFYQNLQDFQTSPTIALALNKAQIWLRDATKKELHRWINELSDPVSRRELLNWIRPIKAETKPFESPHYWAAFCAIGQ
ncbi:CHAT domain-containing tetratricopeptide repeat protein [Microcoleus sp. D2_18a_D3]|uniref:CHAT domain-containing tetratricopeptide repeat protein n=1 Tax=Microcoleus sp. D2_18a_D3 TaxID=3055330 RepID=UPI002FD32F48